MEQPLTFMELHTTAKTLSTRMVSGLNSIPLEFFLMNWNVMGEMVFLYIKRRGEPKIRKAPKGEQNSLHKGGRGRRPPRARAHILKKTKKPKAPERKAKKRRTKKRGSQDERHETTKKTQRVGRECKSK